MAFSRSLSGAAVLSLFILFMSSVFLLVSFSDPQSKWSLAGVELHGYLFAFCLFVYVPLMVVCFCLSVKCVVGFVKLRSLRGELLSLVSVFVGAASLYKFNSWVFGEIY